MRPCAVGASYLTSDGVPLYRYKRNSHPRGSRPPFPDVRRILSPPASTARYVWDDDYFADTWIRDLVYVGTGLATLIGTGTFFNLAGTISPMAVLKQASAEHKYRGLEQSHDKFYREGMTLLLSIDGALGIALCRRGSDSGSHRERYRAGRASQRLVLKPRRASGTARTRERQHLDRDRCFAVR